MDDISNLFRAHANGFRDTMAGQYGGSAGFRIPEYQREYNWGKENIERLFENIKNGLNYLTVPNNDESYTFLGTLILVSDSRKEASFDGYSVEVVDGQQRLTTLVLIACSLIESISDMLNTISTSNLPIYVKNWLEEEARYQQDDLFKCAVGKLSGRRDTTYSFPRLIRSEDARARKAADYQSIVSQFLIKFSEYYDKEMHRFDFPVYQDNLKQEAGEFKKCFEFIRKEVKSIASADQQPENGESIVKNIDFKRRGIKNLFEKMDLLENEKQKDKALSEISKGTNVDGLVRLILFASYLMHCVVLTRVETKDESTAFDIFDALNTTGEALTAIETLKPRVIQFERKQGYKYRSSDSEDAFDSIDKHLPPRFTKANDRQNETKDLIVLFALYTNGEKVSRELSAQRIFLRKCFDSIERERDISKSRSFVSGLAKLAEYRRNFWNRDGIRDIESSKFPNSNIEEIRLCLRFIRDMNTSLAIPLLARYWIASIQGQENIDFVDVLMALTAFIVLRRAATGGTANIDSDFRKIMEKGDSEIRKPLCVGLGNMNDLPQIAEFKSTLQHFLKKAIRLDNLDRDSWVKKVSRIPIADNSRPLSRFLLLAAAHHSKVDKDQPGLWSRHDDVTSDRLEYLTYKNWEDKKYSTVEHIAPENRLRGNDWDSQIYDDSNTIHTLGNLTLLPQRVNSSVGNSSWEKKKLFYRALMKDSKEKRDQYVIEANKAGMEFTNEFKTLLNRVEHLHILESLREVEQWNEEIVRIRSKNIAGLAWDKISPWLIQ